MTPDALVRLYIKVTIGWFTFLLAKMNNNNFRWNFPRPAAEMGQDIKQVRMDDVKHRGCLIF